MTMRYPSRAMLSTMEERIHAIRVFDRFWAERIAVVQAGVGQGPYSLAESRVLFELAQRDATRVVDLRRNLELTGGYVSRMLAKFRASKLVKTEVSRGDARRQVVRLTSKGWTVVRDLDMRWAREIRALLAQIPEDGQRRLVAAMMAIRQLLDPAREAPRPRTTRHRAVARHTAA
jgi:DNA-binding MarR family transcriptional regulator